jgi:hypothetical protein
VVWEDQARVKVCSVVAPAEEFAFTLILVTGGFIAAA